MRSNEVGGHVGQADAIQRGVDRRRDVAQDQRPLDPHAEFMPIPFKLPGIAGWEKQRQVIFSQGGTLSVQAMNPDAAAEPTPYTANGYEAYYGPVEVDEAKKSSPSPLNRPLSANSSANAWNACSKSMPIN
jgi:hypothetical protein